MKLIMHLMSGLQIEMPDFYNLMNTDKSYKAVSLEVTQSVLTS